MSTENKKSKFFAVNPIQTNMPTFFENAGTKWVSYGEDNLYPQFISTLYYKSAINRTAIQSKLDATFGKGLVTVDPKDEYLLKRANPEESWNDVFEKCVLDYIIYGGFALHIVWTKDAENIAEFYHIDFTKVRAGKWDTKEDKVCKYYYSMDWREYGLTRRFKPVEYQAYNPELAEEFPEQIMYFFDYEPGNIYYPLPNYAGSINDIQIDIEVSKFHISNLANGMNPGLLISFNNGIPEPQEREEIYDEVTMAFRGSENAGKSFITFAQDKEHEPTVTPIQSANDNYYVNLESRITSRILTGHRITSPLLLGLYHQGGTGFSSNANEIEVAYTHFIASAIKPLQKPMLKVFNKLMEKRGYPDVELVIEQNTLLEGKTEAEANI